MYEVLPGGPLHTEPAGFMVAAEQRELLVEALVGVELGAWDERIVSWLAGWETGTVVTVASWLRRARRCS